MFDWVVLTLTPLLWCIICLQICQSTHCVGLSSIGILKCPTGTNGLVCSGQGECSQYRECVCDNAVTGVECGQTGTNTFLYIGTPFLRVLRHHLIVAQVVEPLKMDLKIDICHFARVQYCWPEGAGKWNWDYTYSSDRSSLGRMEWVGECNQSCGSGTWTRTRTCQSSNPRSGGSNCAVWVWKVAHAMKILGR